MKIGRIDAIPIRFPQGDDFGGRGAAGARGGGYAVQPGWKGAYSSCIETMIVRVETEDGLVGWGEGQSPIAPNVAASIVETILAPAMIGRSPVATDLIRRDLYELMSVRGHIGGFMLDAISAIDIAMWDLKGKALGVPVCELAGGPGREFVSAYVSGIRGSTDAERTDAFNSFVARGFRTFKFFGGFGSAEDLRIMAALQSAKSDTRLMFDALWKYSREEALHLGRALQAMDCGWFEAPIDGEDIEGHIALANALDMPIAGGEMWRTRKELWPWLRRGAFDIVQPDVGRCGITEGLKAVDLAEFLHIDVALHCGIASPIMIAASLQVCLARPWIRTMEYQPVILAAANELLRVPIECEAGRFVVPAATGLGIDLDEAAISRLAIR